MTRHIILAYGRETEHKRAIFAVLSFWAWYSGDKSTVQTVVFTDRPELFTASLAGLPIEYVVLMPEYLDAMRGPQQYVHRIKVAIVAQTFKNHPNDNLLFCDSDTFFVAESEQLLHRLQAGTSIMHLREYRLVDAVPIYAVFKQAKFPRKFIDLIENRTFRIGPNEQQFHSTQFSWNSGVLGLTEAIGGIMPDIMALNDALYVGSGWIMSEQVAFSLALQAVTRVVPAEQYVFHYWGQRQKVLMDVLLKKLIYISFNNLTLLERLTQVRQLTIKWWRTVELDKNREGALYAFSNGEVIAGIKCTVKALIASPFNAAFTKNLFGILRKKVNGQSSSYHSLRN